MFEQEPPLMTISEASRWASQKMRHHVTPSNISYLINYGRIRRVNKNGGEIKISTAELEAYYESWRGRREAKYKHELGNDLNWRLAFEEYKEAETTKHVHRLHPYKGKFIPQLAEYFLDSHTDEFKTEAVFRPGDIVLDPFCGSGTTLVQANELGLHGIGADVSCFNAMIANLKLCRLSATQISQAAKEVEHAITHESLGQQARNFEVALLAELRVFNHQHFPSPTFRQQLREGAINEETYGTAKAKLFLPTYHRLLERYGLPFGMTGGDGFLDKWYLPSARKEINVASACIDRLADPLLRDMMRLILSRTIRSSRATTHSDLATLRETVTTTYYCGKHGKICKPVFSILGWWQRYSQDTARRLKTFEQLRTNTQQFCVDGDSRHLDFFQELARADKNLAALAQQQKIRGIFSSPPYVGLINYHEQHAYAYELFGYPRNEQSEIGILQKGKSRAAQTAYIDGVADVLINCRRFMVEDFDVLLVANDKMGLYPQIAARAGMMIIKEYKRPVLNRAEGNKGAYSESIFHIKKNNIH